MLELDMKTLKQQLPDATWQKALALIADGAVEINHLDNDNAKAYVQGSKGQRYNAEVYSKKGLLSSMRCDCRGFEFNRSCKHVYALALVGSGQPDLVPQVLRDKAQTKRLRADKKQQKQNAQRKGLQNYLEQLDKTQLTQSLLELIESDNLLKKSWLLKAEFAEQSQDPKFLKKKITQALPLKHLFHYGEVAQYFEQAESCLFEILNAAASQDSETHFDIIMTLYKRLNKALERVDDSGGFRLPLETRLENDLSIAFRALPWSVKKKTQWLEKYRQPPFDVFPDVSGFLIP